MNPESHETIALRPVDASDLELLLDIYRSVRADELSHFGWDELQTEAFLRMQFDARLAAYKLQFPSAQYCVVEHKGSPAGQMIFEATDDHVLLIDVAVLPEFRRKGIARYLVEILKDRAEAAAKPFVLRVDKANRTAIELYKKFGLSITDENEILFQMEWRPS
ncbi:MAG: N-acetyltransferase family protein [Pyrinomonadaceae bacterium]